MTITYRSAGLAGHLVHLLFIFTEVPVVEEAVASYNVDENVSHADISVKDTGFLPRILMCYHGSHPY